MRRERGYLILLPVSPVQIAKMLIEEERAKGEVDAKGKKKKKAVAAASAASSSRTTVKRIQISRDSDSDGSENGADEDVASTSAFGAPEASEIERRQAQAMKNLDITVEDVLLDPVSFIRLQAETSRLQNSLSTKDPIVDGHAAPSTAKSAPATDRSAKPGAAVAAHPPAAAQQQSDSAVPGKPQPVALPAAAQRGDAAVLGTPQSAHVPAPSTALLHHQELLRKQLRMHAAQMAKNQQQQHMGGAAQQQQLGGGPAQQARPAGGLLGRAGGQGSNQGTMPSNGSSSSSSGPARPMTLAPPQHAASSSSGGTRILTAAPAGGGAVGWEAPPAMAAPAEPHRPSPPASESLEWRPGDPVESLRLAWDALLEEAARCLDERRQAEMQRRVSRLMAACVEAGVSVKYGRKVLQRLEAVGPARDALRAALSAEPPSLAALQAALALAKPVRSLLAAEEVARAEAAAERAARDEERIRWDQLAANLSWQQQHPQAAAPPAAAPASAANSAAILLPDSLDDNVAPTSGSGYGMSTASYSDHHHVERDMECVICLSAPRQTCCIPCGHVCMCTACSAEIEVKSRLCPVCRAELELCIEILS